MRHRPETDAEALLLPLAQSPWMRAVPCTGLQTTLMQRKTQLMEGTLHCTPATAGSHRRCCSGGELGSCRGHTFALTCNDKVIQSWSLFRPPLPFPFVLSQRSTDLCRGWSSRLLA
eukprot:2576655-Amphidinium_carterae.1